jgi:thiol:disulfide interchange protein DsbD
MSGVLAVLVASPCTAPFMGSAVGVALSTQISVVESLVIFISLGLGMASPYIILSAIPRLAKLLPRPGKWLDIFKKILSIPLFITAIWLAWLYSKQTGNFYAIIVSIIILSIGLICYGKFAFPHRTRKVRNSAIFGLIVAVMLSFVIILQNKENPTSDSINIENKWSVAKLDELRKNGFNVYVDFTATWCLTCQYNKQILYSEKIKKIFEKNKIKILVADWTSRDNAITNELEKFGRAGVPLNLLYAPQGEPIILPAILTESALIEAVDKIK